MFATTEFCWKRKKKQNKQVEEEEDKDEKKKKQKKTTKKIICNRKCKSVSKTTVKGATTTANNALTCRLLI